MIHWAHRFLLFVIGARIGCRNLCSSCEKFDATITNAQMMTFQRTLHTWRIVYLLTVGVINFKAQCRYVHGRALHSVLLLLPVGRRPVAITQ